jgi:hypothetical protein
MSGFPVQGVAIVFHERKGQSILFSSSNFGRDYRVSRERRVPKDLSFSPYNLSWCMVQCLLLSSVLSLDAILGLEKK